jgi:glucose/arabinose dehydrogenase
MRRAVGPISSTCVAVLVLAACADDGGGDRADTGAVIVTTTVAAPGTSSTSPATSPGSTSAPTSPELSAPTSPGTSAPTSSGTTEAPRVGDPVVRAEAIGSFARPVDLVPRPGADGFYVVEQVGRAVHWQDGVGTVALDVADRVSDGNEQGLLGLAFSADGETAYVDLTDTDGDTVILEFAVGDDGTFDPASERVVLTVDQPYSNHNAGDLALGPDGLLFITLGDGGSAGDPERRAGDPRSLLGSILRIDPTPGDGRGYTIPPDNPFADGPLDGIDGAPEVFAWGLRNPWKIAFDPVTSDLWIADVGQNEFEEVDVVGPTDGRTAGWGHDFGWSAFEGNERFNDDVPADDRMTPPVLTYRHADGGCSVSGGVPYRGETIPELEPAYVYSDYCTGTLWALDLAGQRNLVLLDGFEAVTAVRADAAGELYVLELGGTISRILPA